MMSEREDLLSWPPPDDVCFRVYFRGAVEDGIRLDLVIRGDSTWTMIRDIRMLPGQCMSVIGEQETTKFLGDHDGILELPREIENAEAAV